jgi:hypothetical protein
MDPFFAMVRFVSTKAFPPVSNNWGYFSNPKVDAVVDKARTTSTTRRDKALAELHTEIVDEARSSSWPTTSARAPCRPRSATWCSRKAGSSTSPR